jgi:hypothetical protein
MKKSNTIHGYEMLHISKIIQQNQMDPRNIVSLVKTNRNYRVCVESGLEYHDFILPIIPAPKPATRKKPTKRKPQRKKMTSKTFNKKVNDLLMTLILGAILIFILFAIIVS